MTAQPNAGGAPGRPARLLMLHESPSSLGGSETVLLASAQALRRKGWRVTLGHAEAAPSKAVLDAADELVLVEHVGDVLSRSFDVAHVHLWPHGRVLRALVRRVPVVATAHLPVCPNGARYHYAKERRCDRQVGVACLSVGHYRDGCGHTADERPFGPHAMALSVLRTKAHLRWLSSCSAVVAPSDWQRSRLIADGLDGRRLHVLGGPLPLGSPRAEPPRSGPPIILAAGRLAIFKGFHHLLQASKAIGVDHLIHIAGDGPARQRLEGYVEDAGLRNVHFLGRLDQPALHAEMSRAACVVMPSLWGETFGIVGAEASARGVPVVAYQQAGIESWLSDEVNGLAVIPGDVEGLASSIDRLLRDDLLRERLAAGGRSLGARFGVAAYTASLEEVYESVVPGVAATRPRRPDESRR